ncbi:MAG: hypothetical protein M1308_01190 [Actinobacteria bacterium]|nr:hypothetical protein [Actinomycetota bacterium]MCL5069506.1 hypothetical protein [Actinomycetota bacterium]
MTELTKEELDQGKKVLGGIFILFWVIAVIVGLGMTSLNWLPGFVHGFNWGPVDIGLPSPNTTWIFLALYVAELVGLYMRKAWAVPLGRAGLVVAMVVFFPIGTIFGAILWKRINDPAAKKYLNYAMTEESKTNNVKPVEVKAEEVKTEEPKIEVDKEKTK